MVDMIDQLSNKYLLNSFMVYHDAHLGEDGRNLQVEMIDQLSNKYLLKINGLLGFEYPYGGYDSSVIKQVLAKD